MNIRLVLGSIILAFSCSAWPAIWWQSGTLPEHNELKFSTDVGALVEGKAKVVVAKRSSGKSAKKSSWQTGGPIVKTGPTRGQNRSRNKDGTWRKKRSDAGKRRSF